VIRQSLYPLARFPHHLKGESPFGVTFTSPGTVEEASAVTQGNDEEIYAVEGRGGCSGFSFGPPQEV